MSLTFILLSLVAILFQVQCQELEGWHVSRQNCRHIPAMNGPIIEKVKEIRGEEAASWHLSRFAFRKNYCYQAMAIVGAGSYYIYVQVNEIRFDEQGKPTTIDISIPPQEYGYSIALAAEGPAEKYAKKWPSPESGIEKNDNEKTNTRRILGNAVDIVKTPAYYVALGLCKTFRTAIRCCVH